MSAFRLIVLSRNLDCDDALRFFLFSPEFTARFALVLALSCQKSFSRGRPLSERDIFVAAKEKPDSVSRTAFLVEACAGDLDARQRVERLLQADGEPGA